MEFYKMFAQHYNSIFPWSGSKEEFFTGLAQQFPIRSGLDLGCATGKLVCWLAEQGCESCGVDLSPALLELARKECSATFILDDMSKYLQQQPRRRYDLVVCIGNTLPHLDHKQIQQMLHDTDRWLPPGGLLVIQTVNYHRILKLRPPGLPSIDVPERGITFHRQYDYTEQGTVQFTAILETKDAEKKQTVTLHPVTAREVIEMLPPNIEPREQYGGFDQQPFNPEQSPAWVLVAQKGPR